MAKDASAAASFNRIIFKRLQAAIDEDPQTDLISKIPGGYSKRLGSRKSQAEKSAGPDPKKSRTESDSAESTIWSRIRSSDIPQIVFPLSDQAKVLLKETTVEDYLQPGRDSAASPLFKALTTLTERGTLIWQNRSNPTKAVYVCSGKIAVKIVKGLKDYTEYTSLMYLEEHCPAAMAPRPHGLLVIGNLSAILMSYIPSATLASVWASLGVQNKEIIRNELSRIFMSLRSLKKRNHLPLGGTHGEGCQDNRMQSRRSPTPIFDCNAFENFQFSNPTYGGSVYVQLLRGLLPANDPVPVFTHGDLRLDNIMVDEENGIYHVSGLIDWQYSGFYPAHHECLKATNTMGANEDCDWYNYLPECASPKANPVRWLVDRLWDPHVV